MTAPTFLKLGGARTLGDLKLVSKNGTAFVPGNCYINFYDNIGNQLAVAQDTWITTTYPATLTDRYTKTAKVQIGYNSTYGHWYLVSEANYRKYPMDDYPIPDGNGYLIKVASGHTDGVYLTYNGQVDDEDTDVTVALSVSKLSGNVAPAAITLKDIVFVSKNGASFAPGNCYINFYDSIGNQLAVASDSWITTTYPATLTDRYTKTAKVQVGYNTTYQHWYLVSEANYRKYPMDDYPIAAGNGFLVKVASAHTDGVTVKLPPAIEKGDK